jgi:hypothetical protein
MTQILSASQIQSFVDCERRWGFRYLEKVPAVKNPAAELGSRTHEILAKYLETGLPPDPSTREGKIALPGIKYLPVPGVAKVEQAFTFSTDVASYRGFIDFQYEENGTPIVGDHKTTASFYFGMRAADLLTGIQPTIYAKNAFLNSDADSVRLHWVYYATKGKSRAELVEVGFPRESLAEAMAPIESAATEILTHYDANPPVRELRPNFHSCDKYGGCPFKARCLFADSQPGAKHDDQHV